MTYFHLKTDRRLSQEVEDALRDDIVDLLYLLRKASTACMFDIESGCNLRMGDGSSPCAYLQVKCASMPKDEDIRSFSRAVATLLGTVLDTQLKNTYVVFDPMHCFATGDVLQQ